MERIAIGIDLGTSTSEIAVYQHGQPTVLPDPVHRSPIVPSLVSLDQRGQLKTGEDARANVDLPGRGVREVKRLMGTGETVKLGDKEYRPEEISALILEKLKQNAKVSLGQEVTEAVISVPANFPDAARQATVHAGEIAGLKVLHVINEPTAAALAFGINNIDLEAELVVFDFGGGTLDITVMEMMAGVLDVRCSFGDTQLGGKDFDDAMATLIETGFLCAHPGAAISEQQRPFLKGIAEKTKIALSSSESCDVSLPAAGVKDGEPVDLELEITRDEYESAVAPLLDRAKQCVLQAMKAGKIRPSAIDRVLLVGGTTYMPCVQRLVEELFAKEPVAGISPDLAVALGAAVVAADKMEMLDPETGMVHTDVSAFGLGVEVVESWGDRQVLAYSPLIAPNTPIPYSVTHQYRLLDADQRAVEVRLLQDHFGCARLCQEAIFTGISGRIDDIPPALYGTPHPIEVEFSYAATGIATLRASIPGMAKSVEFSFDQNACRMSKEDVARARWNLKDLLDSAEEAGLLDTPPPKPVEPAWEESPEAARYRPLISKAERLMGEMPEHKEALCAAVVAMKRELSAGDSERISEAGDALTDLLFDIEQSV